MIITGDAGGRWQNNTDLVWWQIFSSLVNVCGSCLARHGQIALQWYNPYHRFCRCYVVPVAPGDFADAFPNYQVLVADMDERQQRDAFGRSTWLLLKRGIVELPEVVEPNRIIPLRDIVAKFGLSLKVLLAAGIASHIAEQALAPEAAVKPSDAKLVLPGKTATGGLGGELITVIDHADRHLAKLAQQVPRTRKQWLAIFALLGIASERGFKELDGEE